MLTRGLDIFVSIIGLLLFLVMLPWIALFIKLDSKGPVFYLCNRVGKDGKIFRMYKFRTMYETPIHLGVSVSPQGDPRVTPVGRVLRRLKLNEFPQFLNVLKGDMTLVGPRPETPDLAAAYPEEAKRIFSVKPGLVGPNQILGRNEEEFYPPGVDARQYYIEHILPQKLPVDLQYIDDKSFLKDLKYIFLGALATFTGAITRRHLIENRSQLFMLLCDASLCLISFTLAHFLRYEAFSHSEDYLIFLKLLPWALLIRIPIFLHFGFYRTLIRYLTLYDIKGVFSGVTLSSIVLVSFAFLTGMAGNGYARGVFFIDWFCLTTMLSVYRVLLMKIYLHLKTKDATNKNNNHKKRVLIWGAGDAGELCLRYLLKKQGQPYEIIGFIDDDPKKRGKKLRGIKVLGDRNHLDILTQIYKIQEMFVAIDTARPHELEGLYKVCQQLALPVKWFSQEFRLITGGYPKQPYSSEVEDYHSLATDKLIAGRI
ncbi:MAG: hypothetical protein DRG58_10735 [Deltaproteobacteria bacterium]|nr:MAG: hypothetical protein DRG58_10735 [Deltaproteobacteria bacterium]